MMRAAFHVLLLAAAACARSTPPVRVQPSPATPPADSVRAVETIVTSLSDARERFSISVKTQASELTNGGRSDSVFRQNTFDAKLTQRSTDGFSLVLHGPRVIPDSMAGVHVRKSAADTLEELTLSIDPAGKHVVSDGKPGATCAGASALLSPLVARLLTIPPTLHTSSTAAVSDSLNYTSCSGPAILTTAVRLQFRKTSDAEIAVQITGQVVGDSTKALPMRLTGSLTGSARVVPMLTRGAFAESFQAEIDLMLDAESSLRKQSLKQHSEISVQRK